MTPALARPQNGQKYKASAVGNEQSSITSARDGKHHDHDEQKPGARTPGFNTKVQDNQIISRRD
jgi:hypothetical protein